MNKSEFRLIKKVICLLSLSIIILTLIIGCSAAGKAVDVAVSGGDEYDELIALVQGVQKGASNFQLVTDTQYGKTQATTQQTNSYYESVAVSGEVWTGNFRDQENALMDLLSNYKGEGGAALPSSDLNLEELMANGALPDGLGQGFGLYINAVQQAPPPVPDSDVTLALMDITNEAMNTIQLAGTDWNDAVEQYNTRRHQIKGEVVAAVSNFLGFTLPNEFPYYSGGNTGPIKNPLQEKRIPQQEPQSQLQELLTQ